LVDTFMLPPHHPEVIFDDPVEYLYRPVMQCDAISAIRDSITPSKIHTTA